MILKQSNKKDVLTKFAAAITQNGKVILVNSKWYETGKDGVCVELSRQEARDFALEIIRASYEPVDICE